MKKYITWAFVAFALYMVVQFPTDSVQLVTSAGNLIGRLAEQSADFVRGIMNA